MTDKQLSTAKQIRWAREYMDYEGEIDHDVTLTAAQLACIHAAVRQLGRVIEECDLAVKDTDKDSAYDDAMRPERRGLGYFAARIRSIASGEMPLWLIQKQPREKRND